MSITYHKEMIQNTEEWYRARLGIITASQVKNLLTPKLAPAKGQKVDALAAELAAQRINKRIEEGYQSWDMERGHIEEEIARQYYHDNFAEVQECGFVVSDGMSFPIGYSPDGLVGDDGLIEIKSRLPKFQIQTVIDGEVPSEYMAQIQTGLLVTERQWCDFIQFSNGMPLYVERVYPDIDVQQTIMASLMLFEKKVREMTEAFLAKTKDYIKTEYVDHHRDDDISASQENVA